jgi:hypothetical protein
MRDRLRVPLDGGEAIVEPLVKSRPERALARR